MAERKRVKKVNPKKNIGKKPSVSKKGPSSTAKNISKTTSTPKVNKFEKIEMSKSPKKATKPVEKKTAPKSQKVYYEAENKQKISSLPQRNKPEQKRKNLGVIKGGKETLLRRRLTTLLVLIIVVVSIVIVSAMSPTGIIEKITNSISVAGSGKFPITVSGSKVISVKTKGDKNFLLTDSHLSGYNQKGKTFVEYQHSFGSPVLETSAERCLVFNRESTGYSVSNNREKIREGNLKNAIYCGAISDSGTTAFATKSSGYAAEVVVFKKNMTQIFSWYLIEGFVSDIALSNDGKYIAVAVLKVKNGVFSSEITCFKVSEEEAIYTKTFDNSYVRKLETVNSRQFVAVTDNSVVFADFKKDISSVPTETELSPSVIKQIDNTLLVVYSENSVARIVTYNPKGEVIYDFEYSGLIDDIAAEDDLVYILNSNKISILNTLGEVTETLSLSQIASNIVGNQKGVLVVDNMHLSLVEYSSVED